MKLAKHLAKIAKRLRPLRDFVIVKPLKYEHPTLYVQGIQLRKGVVLAVGPGRRMRRKVAYKNHEENSGSPVYFEDGAETGKVRPMRVKVGDYIEYGFRDLRPFRFEGEDLLCIPEQAIYGTTDDSTHIVVLEPRSAPVPV
jgi:co-chaperonin GroES (HSP10)